MKISLPALMTPMVGAGLALAACAQNPATETAAPVAAAPATAAVQGPFDAPSPLPLHYPPFDKITDADFRPAFDDGMAIERREIDAIANNPAPATFENTVVALETVGEKLDRAQIVFGNLNGSNTDDEIQKIQKEYAPKFAAHHDATLLNPLLFARIDRLHAQSASLGLDPVSQQLLDRTWTRFVRAGAKLSEGDKERLKALNAELSSLTTQFQQNLLASTKDGAVVVDDASELDGLPAEQIAAAASAAKARKLDGKWLIPLQNTTVQPPLAMLKHRALRERIWRASVGRSVGGPNDNTAIVAKIVRLRAERARLLGYPTHAAYVLEDEGAATPDAVNAMLGQLAPAAVANAQQEAAEIQKAIDREVKKAHAPSFRLQPWDWAYYAEQVRRQRFAFDAAEVKPYFEMQHVLEDGVFYAAHELYGLSFKRRTDLPVYQADVQTWDVYDRDGHPLAIFMADYFARDNKRGGAWMTSYVSQSGLTGNRPVVVNNLNLVKPPEGQPVLLSFDEVTTMFHEFGHALHGMFSDVKYPSLAGTAVPRDFVEYPSQYNEMWARDPQVLAHFAKHYQTGAPLPKALLDKVLAAGRFGEGFRTTEYIAAAIVDQGWHQIGPEQAPPADAVMAFEKTTLTRAGIDYPPVPPRYHTTYFSHVFAGGYSAGYYAYLWSEVLARDTESWFKKNGGLKRENGDRFRSLVLSRGRSADPKSLFEAFYGKPAEIGPLLEHRGLTLPKAKAAKH